MSGAAVSCIAFTERGFELACRVAAALPECGMEPVRGFGDGKPSLAAWTEEAFASSGAILFVGALGIAVRAIAPHVRSKLADPAVVVLDEGGRWAIPVLSGHVGGANRLAARIARAVGAQAVVTTATDGRGLWAVDEWAARCGLAIEGAERIKRVSGTLLAGGSVRLRADVPIAGRPPEGVVLVGEGERADVEVTPFAHCDEGALRLVPRCVVAGVGCRKGVSCAEVGAAVEEACQAAGVLPQALSRVASIDLKRDEAGLRAFCAERGLPFRTHAARELSRVEGSRAASAFVERVTGVDNVCERAALAGGGMLLAGKRVRGGVTVALALEDAGLSFDVERAPAAAVPNGAACGEKTARGGAGGKEFR